MAMWNPWRGCRRVSEGCKFCYVHQGDQKRKMNTNEIVKLPQFDAPVKKVNGVYKIPAGRKVFVCFSSDFFIEEADDWRPACWQMIKERQDLQFIFLTKRIERFYEVIPDDWQTGYENVQIGCSVENQQQVEQRLAFFQTLPIKKKSVICQPLIEAVQLEEYLPGMAEVIVGGEYHKAARPLDYQWVLDIREQCIRQNVNFDFRQCGTNFIKDEKIYHLTYKQLTAQAKKADINWRAH
ncbi:protein gp37 [Enterococcus sp. PF1-24]|uniref:DUF5131 family protein n=1 Tax=unclassified Enterococcus TaxID=2608891 RepID=UPI0024769533|nr:MULTISPECIES: DUF5131 family protein [unclassified Enterococcus]MDH6363594.1 protein gp37 [Enterococcus sp. PFB1-1]MDH6400829.1 protein gp37 [Enterococcus sp. PF1-24]